MIKEGGFFTNSQVMPLTRKGQMSDVHNIQFDRWNSLENVVFNRSLNYQIQFLLIILLSNRSTLGWKIWKSNMTSYPLPDTVRMNQETNTSWQYKKLARAINMWWWIVGYMQGKCFNLIFWPMLCEYMDHICREWLSPASCLYIIDRLLKSPKGQHYIENLNIHIVPVLNSDGYVFTNSTSTRMWRKNRNPEYSTSSDPDCIGVDLNRNFDYHWGGKPEEVCLYIRLKKQSIFVNRLRYHRQSLWPWSVSWPESIFWSGIAKLEIIFGQPANPTNT